MFLLLKEKKNVVYLAVWVLLAARRIYFPDQGSIPAPCFASVES